MESLGKNFMKIIWRFQQVGALVAIVLVCLNLTIPIYVLSGWRFVKLGIPKGLDWLIIIIIFSIIFSIVLIFGYVYDRILKLWRHQMAVAIERNPYNKGRITPSEMLQWQYFLIPLLVKNDLKAEAEFNLKWNERNMERDPELRKEVFRIMKWVQEYKLKNMDDRYLQDIATITKKRLKTKYGKIKPDW